MKRFSCALAALNAAALIGASTLAAMAEETTPEKIVVTAYGGIWAESVAKNYAPCFEKKTGVRVEILTGESSDWLNKVKANPGNSPIDVITLSELDSLRAAKEGLLEQLSVEKVPNLANIPDAFHKPWDDYGVSGNYGAMGVMYNSQSVAEPQSWKQLIDDIAAGKYGEKVAWPSGTYTWGPSQLWWVAQQYGGDIDVAFEKMKAIKPYVVKFWTTPVEALNLFATGEVDVLVYWDGRAFAFINKGNDWAKFSVPEPGGVVSLVMQSVVKGANPIAYEYINCVLSEEGQIGNSHTMRYPGTNSTVTYPDNLRAEFTPMEKVKVPPYSEIIDRIPEWIERWNKEMQ
jgi:putative spermidine/putrescine transport system substrate-binding protein